MIEKSNGLNTQTMKQNIEKFINDAEFLKEHFALDQSSLQRIQLDKYWNFPAQKILDELKSVYEKQDVKVRRKYKVKRQNES